ncbi:hypothetical protein [Lactiplantibacillus fabifermentans]|uniref:hypothetical protein n=1 Tax=Lactiplantibacillus fabifermentans TaxID=483011 RepID=UPI0012DDE962|nr:hypothetical protein [Lactiplantibacillus fabifermentans]
MSQDLRVLKTKQGIKEAFLALRESRSVNKISIKRLCEDALINKSTFYTYYTDIYDLESQLKAVAIDDVFERLSYKDYLFTNPALFIEHLPNQTPM